MDQTTIQLLNRLNRHFYETVADSFDATRASAWAGWERLLPYIAAPPRAPMTVLDVGCGNGRFGVFLHQHLTGVQYHGFDSSASLLAHARATLRAFPDVTLEQRDLLTDSLPDGVYDGVALFGVLHHIPGAAQRLAFMRALAERVAPGGILALAAWRFYEFPRFRDRVIAWETAHNSILTDASLLTLEAGDYLLDWQRDPQVLRYCHYVDDAEHAALVAATGLTLVDDYRADGFNGAVNRYSILKNGG